MRSLRTTVRDARALLRLTGLSLWNGFIGFSQSDNLTYAASIAYYSLLSVFPLSLLGLAILGGVTADAHDRNAVLSFVLDYFPRQFEFITTQLDNLRNSSRSLSVAGALGLVWGSFGFFGALTSAVNHAWGVDKAPGYWKHKLVSFLMMLVAGGLLIAAMLLMSAGSVVGASWFAEVLSRFPGLMVLRGLAVRNASTLMFVLVVGLIFYFVPAAKVRFRDVWIGAFITGLLWKGALQAFGWYMRDMSRLTQINGSIAAVVVFLIWVYLQAVILLYGVEFTAAYARLRRGRSPEAPAAPPLTQ